MNTHLRPSDPQLQLSILFLALAEAKQRQEACSRPIDLEPDICQNEPTGEEPERWDGMW